MSNTSAVKFVDRFRPWWMALTGGAFVGFGGMALTLMYFWGIGGVPVGQAADTGAMAKVVLSSAFVLGLLFLTAWLAPTLLAQMISDESPFAVRVRQLFAQTSQSSRALAIVDAGPQASAQIVTRFTEPVRWGRILIFSASTMGIICLGMTLMAVGVGQKRASYWRW